MSHRRYSMTERAVAVALAVGVVAGLGALVLPAGVLGYLTAEDEIAGLRTRYVELSGRRQDLGSLRNIRDGLREIDPEAYGLLVADTVDLARAQIQDRLQRIAADQDATIAQVRAVDGTAENQVAAYVDLRVPMRALPELLAGIAETQPPIFVDSLEIYATRRRETDEPLLSLRLEVSSFVTINGAEAAK